MQNVDVILTAAKAADRLNSLSKRKQALWVKAFARTLTDQWLIATLIDELGAVAETKRMVDD